MKIAILGSLMLLATPAVADTRYSDWIAQQGLRGTAQTLAAIDAPTPSDQFALGGVLFLRGIEEALQTRYRTGLGSDAMAEIADIPFLRLPMDRGAIVESPKPSDITTLFSDVLTTMAAARAPLERVTDSDEVAVTIRTDDLWFDINDDGVRQPAENALPVFASVLGDLPDSAPIIRFDTADAAWLTAYTHALAGTAELILATNPEEAMAKVLAGTVQIDDMRSRAPLGLGFLREDDLAGLDALTILVASIEGPLEARRTQAAHAHFVNMLDHNEVFWRRLAAETDNQNEWIPNETQTSALPLTFPPGMAEAWQDVLADARAVLDGELLLPHWRAGQAAGINLHAIAQNPPSLDVIGIIHGYSLAPYMEKGQVIDADSIRAFDEITGGNSPFFSIILN